jgi:hypothetical protein
MDDGSNAGQRNIGIYPATEGRSDAWQWYLCFHVHKSFNVAINSHKCNRSHKTDKENTEESVSRRQGWRREVKRVSITISDDMDSQFDYVRPVWRKCGERLTKG